MNSRNRKFLLSTAVLLAGVSLASAQGMREGGGMSGGGAAGGSGGVSAGGGAGGNAAEHGRSGGGMSQGAGAASRSEGMTEGRGGGRAEGSSAPSRAEHSEGMRDSSRAAGKADKDKSERQTIGQGRDDRDNARQSQSEHEKRGRDQTVGQGHSDQDHARQSKPEGEKGGKRDQSVGQGRSDRDHTRQSQGAEQDKNKTTGANTKDVNTKDNAQGNAQGQSTTTTGANTRNDAQDQNARQGTTTGANSQGQANTQAQTQGGTTQSMSGRVQVSAQQQTRLQNSVLSSRDVERVRINDNSINFRVNAGVVVPRNISVVSVSAYPALIDIYPDYRDDSFFVVDDEIVVLDRSRRIVDVIPAGPRTHYAHRGSSSSSGGGSVAALDLSPDEIRVVQRVLIERGLLSGEADGILGPDTRTALITFQRQEGFQATGSIDTRTVTALGVSSKISATQDQSTTVGQGRNGQSAPQNTTEQNTGQSNAPANQNQAPANQNQTTGQAGQNQPSTSGQAQHNEPTKSGQTTGQAPASGSNQSGANQNMQPGHTNQNNAPPASTSGQPAQKQPGR